MNFLAKYMISDDLNDVKNKQAQAKMNEINYTEEVVDDFFHSYFFSKNSLKLIGTVKIMK